MDGWGGEEVRDGTLVSGLGKWTENGQSCQRVHSFTHSFTDLSHTHKIEKNKPNSGCIFYNPTY